MLSWTKTYLDAVEEVCHGSLGINSHVLSTVTVPRHWHARWEHEVLVVCNMDRTNKNNIYLQNVSFNMYGGFSQHNNRIVSNNYSRNFKHSSGGLCSRKYTSIPNCKHQRTPTSQYWFNMGRSKSAVLLTHVNFGKVLSGLEVTGAISIHQDAVWLSVCRVFFRINGRHQAYRGKWAQLKILCLSVQIHT